MIGLLLVLCIVSVSLVFLKIITRYNLRCFKYLYDKGPSIPFDRSIIGINNTFTDSGFGEPKEQFDIINDLRIKHIRVIFPWLQPTEKKKIDFSFYDKIINSCPDDTKLLIVIAHSPEWFVHVHEDLEHAQDHWFEGWFKPVVDRYKPSKKIIGYEIFNEPDAILMSSDSLLGLNVPENYMRLLRKCSAYITDVDSSKKIVMSATATLRDNSAHLEYNKELIRLGIQDLVDVYSIHCYDGEYVSWLKTNGIVDFLNSIKLPIWITETGTHGLENQTFLNFSKTYKFFKRFVPGVKMFYIYTLVDHTSKEFGILDHLGNTNSDLYYTLVMQGDSFVI